MTDGLLLINKALGCSSFQETQACRRIFGHIKAGHTGTLDPLATGMLVICLGQATKFAQYLLECDKVYTVTARFGAVTDTADAGGRIIQQRDTAGVTQQIIADAAASFIGKYSQFPPMYSALKYQGKPLYKYARQGRQVPIQPRTVCIHDIKLCSFAGMDYQFMVRCRKGTYIRSLVQDIGERVGCGAYVIALHRNTVGHFDEQAMITTLALEQWSLERKEEEKNKYVIPISSIFQGWPEIQMDTQQTEDLYCGRAIEVAASYCVGQEIVLYDTAGCFMGTGYVKCPMQLWPKRLMHPVMNKPV